MNKPEKRKSAARRKLIPAIAMLLISAILLTTASYAWFTMSRDVKVTDVQITATTPDKMKILLGTPNTDGTANGNIVAGYATTVTAPTTVQWGSALETVTFNSVYDLKGKLAPASTINGSSFFYTNLIKGTGSIVGEAAKIDEGENYQFFATSGDFDGKGPIPLYLDTDDTTHEILATDLNNGYYLEFPVWIKNEGSAPANLKLDVSVIDVNGETAGDLTKAVRVAILQGTGAGVGVKGNIGDVTLPINVTNPFVGSTPIIWRDSESKYFNENLTAEPPVPANAAASATALGAITTFIVEGEQSTTDGLAYSDVGTNVLTIGQTGANNDIIEFTVRIWFEGQDTTCVDVNAGLAANIQLSFLRTGNTEKTSNP